MLKQFLSIRWILTSLLVVAVVVGMIRLGFWQLDRLAEKRASNALVTSQINAVALNLNQDLQPAKLSTMEYRSVVVTGTYDLSQEVVLRSQVFDGNLGYDVITPLKIQGNPYSVMVNRGWIPYDSAQPDQRKQYFEPGQITVIGLLRLPQSQSAILGDLDPTLTPGQTRLDTWNVINLDRLQKQINTPILPVYIQQAPDPNRTSLPYRKVTLPDLSDGPHLFYAIQWFLFSAILAVGCPILIRKRYIKRKQKDKS